jgi:hypothetical protein
MVTLTRFLENQMASTLLGLPREIKELIYFDALSHAANKILVSILLLLPPMYRMPSDLTNDCLRRPSRYHPK